MDMPNFTPTHKKGQHLTREERYYISIRLNIDHRRFTKQQKNFIVRTIQSNKRYSVERSICIMVKLKGINLIWQSCWIYRKAKEIRKAHKYLRWYLWWQLSTLKVQNQAPFRVMPKFSTFLILSYKFK